MKISLEWLGDYMTWKESDPQIIAQAITRATGEIDEIEHQGERLTNVVVGRVKNLRKHPNADKLSVCEVETDQGDKPIVCGGSNLKEGMLVALAHVGATVRDHDGGLFTLSKAKIRGEASEGMICAAEELELTDIFPAKEEDGPRAIIELPDTLKVGMPLRDALGLTDTVLHIDNHAITHRPDLFSHKGVARECVALGLAAWKKKPAAKKFSFGKNKPFKMIVDDPSLVSRYCACALEIESAGETPLWMKRRLEATGWRSINLPTDITNYVMMELGMPLHCFDLDDMRGDVHLRAAKEGETITTLDKVERKLPAGAIVLSDDDGIFDLLGIMGGLRSSTKDTSRRLYLHSAALHPVAIRRTVIETGHRTDAATVYEKGVPPVMAQEGFERALALFMELVPGARIASAKDDWGKNGTAKAITLDMDRIASVIGMQIPASAVKKTLTDLGCTVKAKSKTSLSVTPPLWRIGDLTREADLIEEVARMADYNKIPCTLPDAPMAPPQRDNRIHRLRDEWKDADYFECLHLAFTSPDTLRKCSLSTEHAVTVTNPLGEELSLMRTTLLPEMLHTAAREWKKTNGPLRLMEVGNVFSGEEQRLECCAIVSHINNDQPNNEPLLLLKRDLLRVYSAIGYDLHINPTDTCEEWMHDGRSADILLGDEHVGILTEVHPKIRAAFDVEPRTAVARIDLTRLFAAQPAEREGKALPQFPAVTYDETLTLSAKLTAGKIMASLKNADPLLTDVSPVGAYRDGKDTRLTLRFTYRAEDRTLPESDVTPIHQKILASLPHA